MSTETYKLICKISDNFLQIFMYFLCDFRQMELQKQKKYGKIYLNWNSVAA